MSEGQSNHDFPAEWLTTSDLSNTRLKHRARPPIFAVSETTIWRWVKKGILPQPIQIGGRCFWAAADIADMLDRQVMASMGGAHDE